MLDQQYEIEPAEEDFLFYKSSEDLNDMRSAMNMMRLEYELPELTEEELPLEAVISIKFQSSIPNDFL